jgi:hypothetical protein
MLPEMKETLYDHHGEGTCDKHEFFYLNINDRLRLAWTEKDIRKCLENLNPNIERLWINVQRGQVMVLVLQKILEGKGQDKCYEVFSADCKHLPICGTHVGQGVSVSFCPRKNSHV